MGRRPHRIGRGLLAACLATLGLAAIGGGADPAAAAPCANEALRIEQQSTHLPDCRAYEMVSPPEKNGADISVHPSRTWVSAGESPDRPLAVSYMALAGFGDVHGSGIGFDYLAQRSALPGTQGWTTHGTNPLQEPMTYEDILSGGEAHFVRYDAGLTRAVFRAFSPIGPAPNTEAIRNLYLRTDLRTPGAGAYQLMSPAFAPVTPLPSNEAIPGVPIPVGSSPDLSRLLFFTAYSLTADAPSSPTLIKTYLSTPDGVLFVGKIPPSGSSCTGGGCVAVPDSNVIPGASRNFDRQLAARHSLSQDASRIFFTVTKVGADADVESVGRLYQLDTKGTASTADDTTIQVNASEFGPVGAAARYQDAAVDGSVAFFTSNGALAKGAPTGGGEKLYRWTLQPDGEGKRLTFLNADREPADAARPVSGVIGASENGDTVYFLQGGQIVEGEPVLGQAATGIYVWREGEGVSYLGRVLNESDDINMNAPPAGGPDDQLGTRVSPDGDNLLISLNYAPWPGGPDHGNCPRGDVTEVEGKFGCDELYLFNPDLAELPLCISCPPAGGAPSNASVFFEQFRPGGTAPVLHLTSPMSEDARRVFFSTAEPLLEGDTNGTVDAYMWEAPGKGSCEAEEANGGCLSLISTGTSPVPSYFVEATEDGSDAFIATSQPLVGWDVDGSRDLYDVRIDGGFPEPPPIPAPCSGDSCLPAVPTSSGPPSPGSSLFAGGGNVKTDPPIRCKKGERRVRRGGKVRCVRKRTAKRKHRGERSGRRAGADRRASR